MEIIAIPYLERLGISPKEGAVYLSALRLGETTLAQLCETLSQPRTSTEYVLGKLVHRGLVQVIQKGGHRRYAALPPRQILALLKKEQEELQDSIESLQSALPALNQLYTGNPFQPKVRTFAGQDIRSIFEEVLDSPINEMLHVGRAATELVGTRYLSQWFTRRAEKQIKTRSIRIRTEEIEEMPFKKSREYLRTVRFAPDGFHAPSHTIIYGDNVATITTSKENIGTVITSRDHAETMRSWFLQLWKVSSEH